VTSSAPTLPHLDRLRDALAGRLVTPSDADYDALRGIVLGGVDPRPAAIARVANDDDVAIVVRWARDTGAAFAVRSGGHSGAGYGSVDDGLVLDLRDLTTLTIDADGSAAWADAGLTAGMVTERLAERGLVVGFGDTGSVGIGGLTLGGGVGYLVRKHGLTIDNLLAVDLATADGELRRVDAEHEPDLFWALRSGGGNFGVATRFRYRLHPLTQMVGGMLILPATAATVEGFMRLSAEAPDELSTIANVMTCPPMPMVAEEHHGTTVLFGMLCWAGDIEEGERIMERFRALAEPLADLTAVQPYTALYPPEDGDYHPTAAARTMFMNHVDRDLADRIVDRLDTADAPFRAVQLRVLGGASARVAPDATAYAHRTSPIMVNVAAFYDGADDRPAKEAWVADVCAELHQGDDGAYVNFVADEGPDRVRAAYPGGTWDRLLEVKRRWDPDNLFRRNQNVAEPVAEPRP
jgi:FAD/FMN-containing dehydrogenase